MVFGNDVKVDLRLLDIPFAEEALKGVVMEIEDSLYPNFGNVWAGSDVNEAFKDVEVVVFFGGFPRKEGMERKELLEKNS